MRHRGMFVLLIIAIAFAGCQRKNAEREREAKPSEKKAAATPEGQIRLKLEQVQASGLVSVDVVESDAPPVIAVLGRVRARAGGQAEVFSPFPGRLAGDRRLPQVGDYVTQGQQIADVEQQFMASERLQFATTAIELQVSVEQAQQEVELRRTELNRARQLYEGGAISQKQAQIAGVELKQAEAKLEGARRSKQQYDAAVSAVDSAPRRAPIAAPISGTVVAADSTMGQQVDSSKPLLTIADLGTVWVEAAVHERDLLQIRDAKQAEIVIPASPGRSFVGRLVTIGNLVDPQNRTVPVTFSVENADRALKIGMFVEARIPTGPSAKALVIPSSAVISEGGVSLVYVESQPGVYQRKFVNLGSRTNDVVVVTSGLEKGDKVVTVGAQMLRSESMKGQIPVEEEEEREEKKK